PKDAAFLRPLVEKSWARLVNGSDHSAYGARRCHQRCRRHQRIEESVESAEPLEKDTEFLDGLVPLIALGLVSGDSLPGIHIHLHCSPFLVRVLRNITRKRYLLS